MHIVHARTVDAYLPPTLSTQHIRISSFQLKKKLVLVKKKEISANLAIPDLV
jgi:hypothetical protein